MKVNKTCINRVRNEKDDFVTDFDSTLARWRQHFSQHFNVHVHAVIDFRQTQTHTAEILVPEPSAYEVELSIEKEKCHKLQGIEQMPVQLIKAGRRTIGCEILKLVNSIWNKEELPED
jgi:hypothetical protein